VLGKKGRDLMVPALRREMLLYIARNRMVLTRNDPSAAAEEDEDDEDDEDEVGGRALASHGSVASALTALSLSGRSLCVWW